MRTGDEGEVQIDPQVPFQQARQSIKYLLDAAVELITNSDDSYRRLNVTESGRINVFLHRLRGGAWEYFKVEDDAEGMDSEQLLEALSYGGSTSGFSEGRQVRGLWGRGLKETILAIGSGTIETVTSGQYFKVGMWWDDVQRTARWRVIDHRSSDGPNGTAITVVPSTECSIKAPGAKSFLSQLASHYSLRDIWERREGRLRVSGTPGGNLSSRESPILFQQPQGELVLNRQIDTHFGGATIRAWESPTPLSYTRADPVSLAGFIVKSEAANLDNTLLGLEADELARHFWGEIVCDGIAERIRSREEGLLTTTRQGLDWRHRSLREFQSEVAELVKPLIEERRKRLSQSDPASIPESLKKPLTRLLNQLAKDELTEGGDGPGPGSWKNRWFGHQAI